MSDSDHDSAERCEKLLEGALSAMFSFHARSRTAFVSAFVRIIAERLYKLDREVFGKMAMEATGFAGDVDLFIAFYGRGDAKKAESVLSRQGTPNLVHWISNADLWEFIVTGRHEGRGLSEILSLPIARVVDDVEESDPRNRTCAYRFAFFVREITSCADKLGPLLDIGVLARRFQDATIDKLSGHLLREVARLSKSRAVPVDGALIFDALDAIFTPIFASQLAVSECAEKDPEKLVALVSDYWILALGPSIAAAHGLWSPEQDAERDEKEMPTIPVESDGDNPPASLRDIAASVPPSIQPPAAEVSSGDIRGEAPEIELLEPDDGDEADTSEPEEPTAARPSEPRAGVISEAREMTDSDTIGKIELLGLLREQVGLSMDDASIGDPLRVILNQALMENGVRMSDIDTQHGNAPLGDALCEAIQTRNGEAIAEQLRLILLTLQAATPSVPRESSKRPPPPRRRTSSAPEITVSPPLPVRDPKAAARRAIPPPGQRPQPHAPIPSPPPRSVRPVQPSSIPPPPPGTSRLPRPSLPPTARTTRR